MDGAKSEPVDNACMTPQEARGQDAVDGKTRQSTLFAISPRVTWTSHIGYSETRIYIFNTSLPYLCTCIAILIYTRRNEQFVGEWATQKREDDGGLSRNEYLFVASNRPQQPGWRRVSIRRGSSEGSVSLSTSRQRSVTNTSPRSP